MVKRSILNTKIQSGKEIVGRYTVRIDVEKVCVIKIVGLDIVEFIFSKDINVFLIRTGICSYLLLCSFRFI